LRGCDAAAVWRRRLEQTYFGGVVPKRLSTGKPGRPRNNPEHPDHVAAAVKKSSKKKGKSKLKMCVCGQGVGNSTKVHNETWCGHRFKDKGEQCRECTAFFLTSIAACRCAKCASGRIQESTWENAFGVAAVAEEPAVEPASESLGKEGALQPPPSTGVVWTLS